MTHTLNVEVRREKPPLEWCCHRDVTLRRFVLWRSDRPNYRWQFRALQAAREFARTHGAGAFCTVDAYGCAEKVTHLGS